MSYRLYLTLCNKDELEEVRNFTLTHQELCEGDTSEYFLPDMIGACEQDDFLPGRLAVLSEIGQPLFRNPIVQDYFSHYNPKVISEDEFLRIIDACRVRILDYYKSLLANPKKCEAEIDDKVDTWTAEYVTPYNLNTNLKRIVDSYDNDYQIWDLIRIYKSINWEEHAVVLFGW